MNKEEHYTIAFILVIIFYFILNYFHLLNYFGYSVALLFGSVLPDMIEPAKNYTHRNYFHSKRILKIMYYLIIPTLIIGFFINWIFYVFFLVIGYISHLGLDSTTKMGLPD